MDSSSSGYTESSKLNNNVQSAYVNEIIMNSTHVHNPMISLDNSAQYLGDEDLVSSGNKYPPPQSFIWRLWHTICYLIGGISFVIGNK